MLCGTSDAPSTAPNLPVKQGPRSQLHFLNSVKVLRKWENYYTRNLYLHQNIYLSHYNSKTCLVASCHKTRSRSRQCLMISYARPYSLLWRTSRSHFWTYLDTSHSNICSLFFDWKQGMYFAYRYFLNQVSHSQVDSFLQGHDSHSNLSRPNCQPFCLTIGSHWTLRVSWKRAPGGHSGSANEYL